ncbi:hypothetical protein BGZ60DRAFT_178868 [Tricladium varicosporioides]|nr:hypothetical protein BGZ60DRAFT_178868 [Hymenoscyphus varicosporioides]
MKQRRAEQISARDKFIELTTNFSSHSRPSIPLIQSYSLSFHPSDDFMPFDLHPVPFLATDKAQQQQIPKLKWQAEQRRHKICEIPDPDELDCRTMSIKI